MILKYSSSNHARKRQLRVKESKFELNCSSEVGFPGKFYRHCKLRQKDQGAVGNNHPSLIS